MKYVTTINNKTFEIEILRDGHRSAQRSHDGYNKQTAARFHWRHQFFR